MQFPMFICFCQRFIFSPVFRPRGLFFFSSTFPVDRRVPVNNLDYLLRSTVSPELRHTGNSSYPECPCCDDEKVYRVFVALCELPSHCGRYLFTYILANGLIHT